jgi:hypothetical protein
MKLYRYVNSRFPLDSINYHEYEGTQVFLLEYEVLKETRCGSWIEVLGKKKFVNHSCTKQFAYKTIEDARTGFLYRKNSQIKILVAQLKDAQRSLIAMETESKIFEPYFKFS